MDKKITVETVVHAPLVTVWECWTKPENITQWAFASEDWEATAADNDVRTGGTFKTTMATKDKSTSFDFTGTYTAVTKDERIEYDLDDGRHVQITFEDTPDGVHITQTFDPENENSIDKQRSGWQSILDNFKKFAESHQ